MRKEIYVLTKNSKIIHFVILYVYISVYTLSVYICMSNCPTACVGTFSNMNLFVVLLHYYAGIIANCPLMFSCSCQIKKEVRKSWGIGYNLHKDLHIYYIHNECSLAASDSHCDHKM